MGSKRGGELQGEGGGVKRGREEIKEKERVRAREKNRETRKGWVGGQDTASKRVHTKMTFACYSLSFSLSRALAYSLARSLGACARTLGRSVYSLFLLLISTPLSVPPPPRILPPP
jgi:hypothetical protein